MSKTYSSDNIKVLSDREHIQLRKAMYIGEAADPRTLLSEIIDNALDECQAGYSEAIIVSIDTKKHIYEVRDYGRGIPHGKKELNGEMKETLEILLTKSNSGGKFDSSAYNYSCFTGDTGIQLADGRTLTFEELLKEYKNGTDNFCYSISPDGSVSIEKIINVKRTKQTNQLVKITLDNGENIMCTPEHLFLTADGEFISAENLFVGASLMPGYFGHTKDIFKEYDAIFDQSKKRFVLCHELADSYNVRNNIYSESELSKTNKHHKDFNRLNNNPTNIERLTRSEHSHIHFSCFMANLKKNDPDRYNQIIESISSTNKARWNALSEDEKLNFLYKTIHSPEAKKKCSEIASQLITIYNKSDKGRETARNNGLTYGVKNFEKAWQDEDLRQLHSKQLTEKNKNGQQELAQRGAILKSVKGLINSNIEVNKENYTYYKLPHALSWEKVMHLYDNNIQQLLSDAAEKEFDLTANEVRNIGLERARITLKHNDEIQQKAHLGSILKSVKYLLENNLEVNSDNYNKFKKRNACKWDKMIQQFSSVEELISMAQKYNHKIVAIESLTLENNVDVYDLTVSGTNHTFLLSSGVFVHNCGLHGLGITITNALSKHICITSYRKGKYVKGEAFGTDEVTIKYGKSDEHDGTHVIFEPDAKFFNTVEIPIAFVKDRCRIASALGFRARLIVDGEEIDTNASIFDLMKEESSEVSTYVQIEPIEVVSSSEEIMKVAIKYTSETNDRYFGYTNLLVNYLGGTHVQELSKTIITTWKEFIEKHKNVKPAIELHNNDYLVGLRSVCAVFISNPEFSSQTKEKLVVNKKYFEELLELFSKQLYKYLHDHADVAHQLVKRFEQYRAAQNALLSQKEIGSLIKINEESGDNIRRRSVVSKLVDCTSKKRDNTELFLCLAGDTPVKLLNGQNVPIASLVDKENVWLHSTNQFGKFIQARMIKAFKTREVTKMLRIYFTNGTHIDCTHEHRFMQEHTLIWMEAQHLRKWHRIHAYNTELCVDYIKELTFNEPVPVYCLEIDSDEHSFVLGNGAVTHNCEGNSACLRHDTMIRLANDTEATIKDVCERVDNGEIIYVYGKPPKGMPNTGPNIYRVLAGGITRKNALLWRVYFDNGTYVDCTDDHKFMLKDRSFKEAKDLSPNDWISIMTYHKSEFKPYHTHIYHDIYCKYYGIDEIPEGYHIHHKDFNHYNNYPDNLELLTSSEHTTLHNQYNEEWQAHIGDSAPLLEYWLLPEHREEHKQYMIKRFEDPDERLKTSIATKKGMSKITKEEHHKRLDLQKYNLSLAYYKDLIYYRKIFTIETIFDKDKFKNQKMIDGHKKSSWQYLYPETFIEKYNIQSIEEFEQLIKDANHRVVKIECLNIYEDVYDIEVEDVHNFCLANDVIVHNCGPYLYTRNKELQAILPLRGKILNVTFKSIKDAVQNSEICDIANAIGAGIGASCDASKSRYDKIIISSDADEDGKHITSLLASLFVNLFPDLVKEGKVWIALPPLYSWGDNPKNFGWCNDINDIPKSVKTFHRFKGLGEMQPEQLKYYCVDPETRRQIQLEYPSDIDEFNRIVGSSQGKNDLLKDLGIIEEGI